MKARILALLLALVMVASLFAACSAGKTDASGASTGASQTTDDSKTTEDTKPAKTEKTKIVYWHSYTDQHEEKFRLQCLAGRVRARRRAAAVQRDRQQDHAGGPQRHRP